MIISVAVQCYVAAKSKNTMVAVISLKIQCGYPLNYKLLLLN